VKYDTICGGFSNEMLSRVGGFAMGINDIIPVPATIDEEIEKWTSKSTSMINEETHLRSVGIMQANGTLIRDKKSAAEYDHRAKENNWLGPDVVFGLAYEYVRPGDTLLDRGIGSGLSSTLFHKAGLRVYGLDGSGEILEVCKSKGFAVELKQHDLRSMPLPYPSGFFDQVISVAVLNSFRDLGPLFKETARIVKEGGIFAFTVEEQKCGQDGRYEINRVNVSEKPKAKDSVMLFRHSDDYSLRLLDDSGFILHKSLEFLAFKYPAENKDIFFKAYIAKKAK
jgi:SAM-dependent methyltransferase